MPAENRVELAALVRGKIQLAAELAEHLFGEDFGFLAVAVLGFLKVHDGEACADGDARHQDDDAQEYGLEHGVRRAGIVSGFRRCHWATHATTFMISLTASAFWLQLRAAASTMPAATAEEAMETQNRDRLMAAEAVAERTASLSRTESATSTAGAVSCRAASNRLFNFIVFIVPAQFVCRLRVF